MRILGEWADREQTEYKSNWAGGGIAKVTWPHTTTASGSKRSKHFR